MQEEGTRRPIAPGRIIGTVIISAIGLWFALSRHAKFGLGGDSESTYKYNHVIPVDAHGLDAIAIGLFIIGLGIVNLAVGIRDRRRIFVFWTGAGLMGATLLFGVVSWIIDQVQFFAHA